MRLKPGLFFLIALALFTVFFTWKSGKPGLPELSLVPGDSAHSPAVEGIEPLKLGLAAVYSPQRSRESYRGLAKYLSDKIGYPVELIQRSTYAEINKLLEQGKLDLALVSSLPYVLAKEAYGARLLVVPQVNGEISYSSYLIGPNARNLNTLEDLWDKTVSFSDPDSFSGSLYLVYRLFQIGETSDSFLRSYFYSGNHEYSVRALVDRIVDAAPVNSIVFYTLLTENPRLNDHLTIIDRSPPVGNPPIIAGPNLSETLYLELQQVFLEMHLTEEGQQVLSHMGFDRFVTGDDDSYDYIRRILAEMKSSGGSYR